MGGLDVKFNISYLPNYVNKNLKKFTEPTVDKGVTNEGKLASIKLETLFHKYKFRAMKEVVYDLDEGEKIQDFIEENGLLVFPVYLEDKDEFYAWSRSDTNK